jgi:DNA-binding NarL/FixJ family response regulator
MTSIQKHWQNALERTYKTHHIDLFDNLIDYLNRNNDSVIILFDETSVTNIEETLLKLNSYNFATVLLFNALPDVTHAIKLLTKSIKGYENSYIHKENLLKMIRSVEGGQNWLFPKLTHYIINKYIQDNDKKEITFMKLLTEQEKSIALMIADGLTNKEISQKKSIALSTVKGHIHHIFDKVGVADRFALALKFKQ